MCTTVTTKRLVWGLALLLGGPLGSCKQPAPSSGDNQGAMKAAPPVMKRPRLQPAMRPAPRRRARPTPGLIQNKKQAMERARKFIGLLRDGKYQQAYEQYSPELRKGFKEAELKDVWQKLTTTYGKFERLDQGAWLLPKGHLAFVFLPAWFQKGKFDLIVPVQGDKGVAGLRIRLHEHHGEFPAPPYADRAKFLEKKVKVGEGTVWALPGTLTTPKGATSFAAVVLVHGSGPQDRDLTFGPNKAYRDLAWGLASRGIAVLRYDKRTKVHARRMRELKQKITHEQEYVADALAGVKLLHATPGVKRIFVVGHSDGATMVPLILQRAKAAAYGAKVGGGVLLAGPSRQLYENFLEQIRWLAKVRKVEKEPAVILQIASLEKAVKKVQDPKLSPDTPNRELPMGASAVYWLARRAYKHKAVARQLKLPLLVLNGGRDYQVTAKDFQGWKVALRGKANAFLRSYPQLNHMFFVGKGAPNPREYYTPSHVAKRVVEDLAHFVQHQTLKK